MEALAAGVVEPDVVRGPAGAEDLAACGQLPDEVREPPVVRVPPGLGTQDRDGVSRHLLPVGVEVGRARVEKDEARRVRRPVRAVEMLGVEGSAETVCGEDVHSPVPYERRRRDRMEDALHAGPDPLLPGAPTSTRRRVRRTREVEEMVPLGLVELKGTG